MVWLLNLDNTRLMSSWNSFEGQTCWPYCQVLELSTCSSMVTWSNKQHSHSTIKFSLNHLQGHTSNAGTKNNNAVEEKMVEVYSKGNKWKKGDPSSKRRIINCHIGQVDAQFLKGNIENLWMQESWQSNQTLTQTYQRIAWITNAECFPFKWASLQIFITTRIFILQWNIRPTISNSKPQPELCKKRKRRSCLSLKENTRPHPTMVFKFFRNIYISTWKKKKKWFNI